VGHRLEPVLGVIGVLLHAVIEEVAIVIIGAGGGADYAARSTIQSEESLYRHSEQLAQAGTLYLGTVYLD
jgi:hypothetical protein